MKIILKACHPLIDQGLDLEVTDLIGYAIKTSDNGVSRQRLTELEEREFSHIAKEYRVMQRYALVTDVAEQRGEARGREKGHAEGRKAEQQQIALRLLESGADEATICKVTGFNKKELALLKKSLAE